MNREEAHKHKKRKSSGGLFVGGIFVAVCVSVLIAFLFALGGAGFEDIFLNENYWLTVGVVNGMLLIGFLLMYRIDAQNVAMKENDLEDTEWLTTKKLRKLKEFTVTTWDKVAEKDDEIVIGAEKKGKAVEIISTSALHALIVGTTGSGKTTGFVDQNIAILGRSKGKPSMIIADPKKELYEKHAKQLESEGYKISTLDLREPYSSVRWNPMQVLIRRIRQVRELQNDMQEKDGKYLACGEVFLSHSDARTRVQELKDEIFENAMDLVYTLCPIQNKDQPTWEEGARNLIFGLVLAFCEDVISGKMDEKQLQLFNVYHNITKYCSEDTTALKKYLLEGREEFSKVRGLVNTVLITSDKTLTSYLSEVNSYIQQLSDDGILSMTSENDIDIANMDESPNALFVIVPDERFTRHRFVTLFLTQTYKELVEKANTNLRKKDTDTAILKRNPVERIAECRVGYTQTTVVGDILAQREVTVGMNRIEHDDIVVLFGQNLGPLVELLGIFGRPPVVQVTILVVLTALVVESVSHLVTDNHTDSTVVHGIVGIEVKEGRLQNTGGQFGQ